MARTPGSGRRKGTPNVLTSQFKDAVRITYDAIGGHAAFAEWARTNRGAYYSIAARLLPGEMQVRADQPVLRVIVDRGFKLRDQEARHHAAPATFENSSPPLLKGDGG